jgi:hypothetical protein
LIIDEDSIVFVDHKTVNLETCRGSAG